jgi:hypothetical protein
MRIMIINSKIASRLLLNSIVSSSSSGDSVFDGFDVVVVVVVVEVVVVVVVVFLNPWIKSYLMQEVSLCMW